MVTELPRGQIVFGRHADHHIAGYVWHRDDSEGHDDGRVWWSHHHRAWQSWATVEQEAERRNLVLIPLMPPGYVSGHGHSDPDGACTDACAARNRVAR